jgi:hypothetical protein
MKLFFGLATVVVVLTAVGHYCPSVVKWIVLLWNGISGSDY